MNRWKIAVPAIGTPALKLAERMLNECLDAYWDEKADANLNGTIQCRIASGEGFSPEEYKLAISEKTEEQTVEISSASEAGLLYGVSDFVNLLVPNAAKAHTWMNPYYFVNPFQLGFAPCELRSAPKVKRRGLWTWGHVIYDYRGYLENMARLKLNEIVIWNDFAPLNASEIVEYAHALGIRVIWGYSWGWDNHFDVDLSDTAWLHSMADQAVERFQREYAGLPGDGIYFQSFTETTMETCGGRIIAEVAVEWVNRICGQILSIAPGLELQFGLHATSVRQQMRFIAQVDPRVRIVWEDCGAFPYDYLPESTKNAAETAAFTKEMLGVRERGSSGVVTKGMICLDWTDFVHRQGPERIGEAGREVMLNRLPTVNRVMRMIQSYWLCNGNRLLETVRQIVHEDTECQILALMEDGLFERCIWLPPALFAAALWDCGQSFDRLLTQTAQRPDVVFADAPSQLI